MAGKKVSHSTIRTSGGSKVRVLVWLLHLALPILGLVLLIVQPSMDMEWQDQTSHFWIVAAVALLNVAIGVRINEEAKNHQDARLFLVSLAFLASAGFLCLHALATPNVIVAGKNSGFELATPVGLLLGAFFGLLSSVEFTPESSKNLIKRQAVIRTGLLLVIVAWGVISLGGIAPLSQPLSEQADVPLVVVAVFGIAIYVLAVLRYFRIYRRTTEPVLIGVITAFALLAEALLTVVVARSWKISWWEWHLLTAAGFGFVAYSAYLQYRRNGVATGLFSGLGLQQTVEALRAQHSAALSTFIDAVRAGEESAIESSIEELSIQLDLDQAQVQTLREAATAVVKN